MQRHIGTCVSAISSLAVKLPTIPSYISYILVAMLSTFIVFDWYLETSNLEADTTNLHLKELSCNLMLEGYLIRREDSWGHMRDSVTSYWETLQCTSQVDIKHCDRLRKLNDEHTQHSDNDASKPFQILWEFSHCDENLGLIAQSIVSSGHRHGDKLIDAYLSGNISISPSQFPHASPSPATSSPP